MAEEESDTLYCAICEMEFQHTRAYLVHCSGVLHNQKRALQDEQETRATEAVPVVQPSTEEASKVESSVKDKTSAPQGSPEQPDAAQTDEPPAKKKKKRNILKLYDETNFDVYYCKLCDCNCTGMNAFKAHCAGKQHCKKYLLKQNELGFKTFFKVYGNLLYDKDDDIEPPPDVQDDYVIHAYRSGVYNKLFCRACSTKLFTFRAWYDHVLSEEHGQKMVELLELRGGPAFMSMFGDLPGPNPQVFGSDDNTDSRRYKFTRGAKRPGTGSTRSLPSREDREFDKPFPGPHDRRDFQASGLDDLRRDIDRNPFRRDDFSGRRDYDDCRNPFSQLEDFRSFQGPPPRGSWPQALGRGGLPAPGRFAREATHGGRMDDMDFNRPNNFQSGSSANFMPSGGGRQWSGPSEQESFMSLLQRAADIGGVLNSLIASQPGGGAGSFRPPNTGRDFQHRMPPNMR